MHPLLEHQIKQYLNETPNTSLEHLLNAVNHVYMDFDKDKNVYDSSLQSMSSALLTRNSELCAELAQKERVETELRSANLELQQMNNQLKITQRQLLQAEKMASIGSLAAGVAHEINNPIGYVNSNLESLNSYLKTIFSLITKYDELGRESQENVDKEMQRYRQEVDYDFICNDINALLSESKEGITRVKQIIQSLRDFSRIDTNETFLQTNIHLGIDSTLNIVHNEIKYKAEIIKEYGALPDIECLPSQLNQVFMNMLVNAGHAIDQFGKIWIRTSKIDNEVCVEFEDTGSGIEVDNIKRIFDPFFTTKEIGKGTGLGLALSYGIVQKHHGRIDVHSQLGVGTRFSIWLPIKQQ